MTNARAAAALGVVPQQGKTEETDRPTSVGKMLEELKPQLQLALPRHMTADRMARIVLTEMRRVPKLFQCDVKSLFGAVIQAAQLGLEPGNALGHAYLIPFENRKKQIVECQLLIGYRGMMDLARRSERVGAIYAEIVRHGDKFEYERGAHPKLIHVPSEDNEMMAGVQDSVRGAYAVAHLRGETIPQMVFLPLREIDLARKRSRAGNEGPWVTDFEAMAMKTAVRRLFKWLPVSIEMQSTMATVANLDTAVDLGESQNLDDVIDGQSRDVEDGEPPQAPQEEAPEATK